MAIQLIQEQKLKVSQKMIQSAAILQMNNTELRQYLDRLALENPLMDLDPSYNEAESKKEWLRSQDEQNRVYERQERKDSQDPWNLETAMTETLLESLKFQLSGLKLSATQQKLLGYMVLNLEPSGYLELPLEKIAEATHTSLEEAADALEILQALEPDGIGARSLQECLCIQLRKNHALDQTAYLISRDHLDLLKKNQLPALAKKLHLPLDEVLRACKVIRGLNPRPGASFGDRKYVPYIHPELVIVRFEGYFDILLNDSELPPIRFNPDYLELMNQPDSDAAAYLKEKKQQLDFVNQCMEQRGALLLKLGRLIVEQQQDFFQKGPGCRRSFTQAEAAELLQVHESVISRAIRDKYLQCAFGVFPLGYFFMQGLEQKDEILHRILELISGEDKKKPLSDQTISNMLTESGWKISKRLVTKYRNELNIPDTTGRREY